MGLCWSCAVCHYSKSDPEPSAAAADGPEFQSQNALKPVNVSSKKTAGVLEVQSPLKVEDTRLQSEFPQSAPSSSFSCSVTGSTAGSGQIFGKDMQDSLASSNTSTPKSAENQLFPISQAPREVEPTNKPELPYMEPYIPPAPGLPPGADEPAPRTWAPGRRRALLIACNYASLPYLRLRGCVNDANCIKHLLLNKFRFQTSNIMMLHDEQPHPEYLPTKANILAGIRWLLADSQPQDSLFFFFSGYGLDRGWEHKLMPCDVNQAGELSDSEISAALVAPLPAGAQLTAFLDVVGGSSSLRLPYLAKVGPGGWGSWATGARSDFGGKENQGRGGGQPGAVGEPGGGQVVLFHANSKQASPLETSVHPTGVPSTGAVAWSFIQAAEQGHTASYNVMLRAMRYALKNGPSHFPDEARISASSVFDLNTSFQL